MSAQPPAGVLRALGALGARLRAERAERRALLVMTALGAIMSFIPLFDVLGYESAALTGAVAGALSLGLSERALAARDARPLDPRWSGAWAWLWDTLAWRLLLVAPPLVALSLNALRVPSCAPGLGLLLWGLIPCLSVALGHALAWTVAALWRHRGRRRLALAALWALLDALWAGLHILWHPPITGHPWLIGYFSGSIYDEAMSVPMSLVYARATWVAGALGVVIALEAARRWRAHEPMRRWGALAAALLLSAAALLAHEERFGVRVTRETIVATLGGTLETEHFIIHYAQHPHHAQQLELLAQDHELRYAQMKAYFDTDPVASSGSKVKSFVYATREQKGALMGASRTLIAKIWLREMHITWSGYGDHLLAHELAHIFTEPFGTGPLRLSTRYGVGVNMGLVEGVATAADDPPSEMSLHEASAAMRELGLAPDLRRLVGAQGFWTQSSARAYTLMGSFVRFLVDEHGMERFKRAYGHGDFEGVYGVSIDELVTRWEGMIDAIPRSPEFMALARYRYSRPSIFGKVCARAQAQLVQEAQEAAALQLWSQAIERLERVIAHDPQGSAAEQRWRASLLLRAERLDEAQAALDALSQPQATPSPVEQAEVEQLLGDLAWARRDLEQASRRYTSCLTLGLPDDARRTVLAKREALTRPAAQAELGRALLMGLADPRLSVALPLLWVASAQGKDALADYLAGRALYGVRRWADAREHLERALQGLEQPELRHEAQLLLGAILTHLRDFDMAQQRLEALLAGSPGRRVEAQAREWIERGAWLRAGRPE